MNFSLIEYVKLKKVSKYLFCYRYLRLEKMSHKVKYSDFDPSRIIFGKTDEANATGQDGKPIKYFRIPIQYNYEITMNDGRKTSTKGPLYIEGPKETSRGPQTKIYAEKGNKEVHSVFTKYDLTNPEQHTFINRDAINPGTIHKLCLRCCDEVFERSGDLGIGNCFSAENMLAMLHYPVKWTLEKGKPVPGENPAGIWKLFRYGTPPNIRETSFILPVNGGQKISWDMIKESRIQHQPVFKVDNITIAGGRPSIKIEMASSVIHDIMEGSGPNLQADTIAEASKDEYVTAKLLEKIKELEAAIGNKSAPVVSSNDTAAPASTDSGIMVSNVPVKVETPLVIPGIVQQTPDPAPVVQSVSVPEPVVPATLASIINSPPIPLAAGVSAPIIPAAPVVLPPLPSTAGGLVIPPLP